MRLQHEEVFYQLICYVAPEVFRERTATQVGKITACCRRAQFLAER